MTTARGKIALGIEKACTKLAAKELGGRDRALYYRVMVGTGGDAKEGQPPTLTAWTSASSISPNPVIEDIKHKYVVNHGILQIGDIKVRANTPNYEKSDLESYEYALKEDLSYIEYSLIGGAGIVQDKNKAYWIMYLRKKQ